ncbi:MAG: AAA family ATPase, partial [Marinilabiliales bacterium]
MERLYHKYRMELISRNAECIENEINWLTQLIDLRFKLYFRQTTENSSVYEIDPPVVAGNTGTYANLIKENKLSFLERAILILALVPHVRPGILDVFLLKNEDYDKAFTEFGGKLTDDGNRFMPSIETLAFILAGNDLAIRFKLREFFEADHFFIRNNILRLSDSGEHATQFNDLLMLTDEFVDYLTNGKTRKPVFSSKFHATLINTEMEWSDLVINKKVLSEINLMIDWIHHHEYLFSKMSKFKYLKKGYRSLFHGPPGTGKSLTASLIGKKTGKDVYHIDLSMVVSKWVGETEKN